MEDQLQLYITVMDEDSAQTPIHNSKSMVDEATNSGEIRILMFPWLAHGHISPFLELANKLVSRLPNVQVHLCSSPINLASITKLIKHPSRIKLIELNLPSLPDLPPHSHTTKDLPTHLLLTLMKALDMASSDFSQILTTLSPDLLICDFFQPWASKLAFSLLKIPTVLFMTIAAISTVVPFTSMKSSGKFDCLFPLRSNYFFDYEQVESPSIMDRVFQSWERSAGILLVKSFREIEAEYIQRLSELVGKSVLPVGPLVPGDDDENQQPDNDIINWLNNKAPSSVVYISFGSESYLSRRQIEELAHALVILIEKAIPINFVWVLRFPQGEEVAISEALPEGFSAAVGERGYVTEDWAPQRRILRHESVGGFVSHCGWSSVMEGMKYGVPMVAMPLQNDQSTNASLVEEAGVGLKVGEIERGELAKVIEEVMIGSNNIIKDKAKEIKHCLLEKGDRDIDEAIDRLVHLCKTFAE
uniref:Glycosyltransferase n=1 Tax=Linum usitatissimum TaxID=4006 RepID=I2BHE2_LINUS|nr:UDP-glycosyltransferase 1 [Linum usitatissimum]